MSDLSSPLKQLGQFAATSPLAGNDPVRANDALWRLARSFAPARPVHQRIGDMLGVVRALTSRTRRLAHPRVHVDIDVFAPGGERALRIFLPADH